MISVILNTIDTAYIKEFTATWGRDIELEVESMLCAKFTGVNFQVVVRDTHEASRAVIAGTSTPAANSNEILKFIAKISSPPRVRKSRA